MNRPMTQPFLPKVSVIIPIYNGERDLSDLISCLLSQSYPAENVEYLLVDNNSSDRTLSLLQSAAESAASSGWTIRPITENNIQSSYAARNAGIRAATTDIFAFTDADCRPEPDWLTALIQPFENPNIGIVVGEIMALPGTTLLEQHAQREDVLSQKHTLANTFCPYGQTANLAIRKKAFQEVGLFRPHLTTGGDADICWRIQRESNWQLHFAPTAIVRHRHRSTMPELQSQWRRYGRSNRYLHELHGVKLMQEPTLKQYAVRLGRWLVKELPMKGAMCVTGKATLVDLLSTPIGLINVRARAVGQNQAKLSEEARVIEWLEKNQDVEVDQ